MSQAIYVDALMRAMYHRAFETDGDTMWQSGCWVRYRAIEQVVKAQPVIEVPRWIPSDERLPEEPSDGLHDMDNLAEYNVMIDGAAIPTTLYYAGSGEWYRDGEFYKVTAWQPLPEPYTERKGIWES